MKRKLQEFFIYFILYSIIGWCYEVFLEVFIYRWGFSNRGVLLGPYCIVYGFGALLLIILLSKLQKKKIRIRNINVTPIIMFISIIVITTIVELIASYIMEYTSGNWLWDYTRFSFNFEGRIALNPSIRFGIGGMIFLYLLQPLFEKWTNKLTNKKLNVLTTIIAIIFVTDIIYTFILKKIW